MAECWRKEYSSRQTSLSFVDKKKNQQWVWLALDTVTREIVDVYMGARDEEAAQCLWDSLPAVYPRVFGGKFPPETLDVSAPSLTLISGQMGAAVLPITRHCAVGKETGKTSLVERFNNTLRQRVSRLVGKTLSFSKSLENHIGALWYFVHYCNTSLLV